jgi:hypothetical protein
MKGSLRMHKPMHLRLKIDEYKPTLVINRLVAVQHTYPDRPKNVISLGKENISTIASPAHNQSPAKVQSKNEAQSSPLAFTKLNRRYSALSSSRDKMRTMNRVKSTFARNHMPPLVNL